MNQRSKIKLAILSLPLCLWASQVHALPLAHAACAPKKIIFSCTSKGEKKKIEVCDQGKKIRYTFGREMTLEVDRKDASTSQWKGIGGFITYSVTVPNKDVAYEVGISADRNTEEHEVHGGVYVSRGDKILANVKCIESSIVNNIEGINLKEKE